MTNIYWIIIERIKKQELYDIAIDYPCYKLNYWPCIHLVHWSCLLQCLSNRQYMSRTPCIISDFQSREVAPKCMKEYYIDNKWTVIVHQEIVISKPCTPLFQQYLVLRLWLYVNELTDCLVSATIRTSLCINKAKESTILDPFTWGKFTFKTHWMYYSHNEWFCIWIIWGRIGVCTVFPLAESLGIHLIETDSLCIWFY